MGTGLFGPSENISYCIGNIDFIFEIGLNKPVSNGHREEKMKKGKLFVIDGTDGSGKQTQLQKLKERFDKEGIEYKVVSFPNYDSPSSSLVKMYLNGDLAQMHNLLAHI